jgi:hypothetical protein
VITDYKVLKNQLIFEYWHALHYEYFMEITIGDIDATVIGGTP